MPTYIQLVHFGHVIMQLVNVALQFASVDITNGLNVDVVLRLFSTVVYVISLKSEVNQQLR